MNTTFITIEAFGRHSLPNTFLYTKECEKINSIFKFLNFITAPLISIAKPQQEASTARSIACKLF